MYNRYSIATYGENISYEWGGYEVVEKEIQDGELN